MQSAQQNQWLSAWPTLNKQDQLEDYISQLRSRLIHMREVVIEDQVYLTSWEWEDFTHGLLTDRPWLKDTRGITLVVSPGEKASESVGILVDTQGYEYARYVGFYIDREMRATFPPGLLDIGEAMDTKLGGVLYRDRILSQALAECREQRLLAEGGAR
jgi:hypothetical protein